MNTHAAIQQVLKTSPLELMYRWNKYQEARQHKQNEHIEHIEHFEMNVDMNDPNKINVNMPSPKDDSEAKYLFGLGASVFFVFLLLLAIPFFLAIYLLIKHGDKMPMWAKILGWVLLLTGGGSIITIILVYATKSKEEESS
jgi:hypothetical protein